MTSARSEREQETTRLRSRERRGREGRSAGRWSGSRPDGSEPSAPDGQLDDDRMPTTDGEMASGTSEEIIPPRP